MHLSFPGSLVNEPVLWQLSRAYSLAFNIRQADIAEGIGWIMAELEGDPQDLEDGIEWLEGRGVIVALIEQDVFFP